MTDKTDVELLLSIADDLTARASAPSLDDLQEMMRPNRQHQAEVAAQLRRIAYLLDRKSK